MKNVISFLQETPKKREVILNELIKTNLTNIVDECKAEFPESEWNELLLEKEMLS